MTLSRLAIVSSLVMLAGAVGVSAHVPLQPPGAVHGQVSLAIGGTTLTTAGPAECNHSAGASIYEAPGRMWAARQQGSTGGVNLTLWRLARGGDMFTLSVTAGGRTHRVNTLTVGPASDRRGSGTAVIATLGKGGQFTISAVADTGVTINGTITCSAFTAPEDNG